MQDGMKFCSICGAPLTDEAEKVNLDKEAPTFESATDMGAANDTGTQQNYGQAASGQQQYYGGYGQPGQPGGGFNGGVGGYGGGYGGYGGDPYGAGMGMGMAGMPGGGFGIPTRSIATCIILSFLTCGIYVYYWLYCITEETNRFSNEPNPTSGGMTILLGLVTCGIYFVYWYYKRGELIDNYYVSRGYPPQSNAVLYLILSLVGLGLVSMALMQSELNKISRGM